MQIIKEKLDIDEVLEKKIKNILKFLNIKSKIIKGNIESNHIQFGIAISNFQIPYLNEIIYTKLNYMMIFEEVIDTSFDSTHYQIAFLSLLNSQFFQ